MTLGQYSLRVNGKLLKVKAHPMARLLDVLRFEFVEHRIDHQRLEKNQEHDQR